MMKQIIRNLIIILIGIRGIFALESIIDPVLKKGDVLKIKIEEYSQSPETVKIDIDGEIILPFIGKITAAGLKLSELKQSIYTSLLPYIKEPKIQIYVEELVPRFYLFGAVIKPGSYGFSSGENFLDIINAAVPLREADLSKIKIIRKEENKTKILKVNLQKFFRTGDFNSLPKLKSEDILVVPFKPERIWRKILTILFDITVIYDVIKIIQEIQK